MAEIIGRKRSGEMVVENADSVGHAFDALDKHDCVTAYIFDEKYIKISGQWYFWNLSK